MQKKKNSRPLDIKYYYRKIVKLLKLKEPYVTIQIEYVFSENENTLDTSVWVCYIEKDGPAIAFSASTLAGICIKIKEEKKSTKKERHVIKRISGKRIRK